MFNKANELFEVKHFRVTGKKTTFYKKVSSRIVGKTKYHFESVNLFVHGQILQALVAQIVEHKFLIIDEQRRLAVLGIGRELQVRPLSSTFHKSQSRCQLGSMICGLEKVFLCGSRQSGRLNDRSSEFNCFKSKMVSCLSSWVMGNSICIILWRRYTKLGPKARFTW
ncbi:hypothetical protein BpHYR1_009020 [Brachionus plicatilis]|uniref:Uncharacterized protein n=1 Tax=Brachionus plicatilis TaxID=10195 RepID=A0A3M7QDG7_BRAPC|nr:hypothetical protein BpHYR1_009020 [Brachionus plicatilis]